MPSDLLASYLVLAATANLRETVRATSAYTVHSETDDHLRETISTTGRCETSPGNRKADRSTKSGLPDLSETNDLVCANLSKTHLLRAYVSEIDVSGT